ncbi:30S ribosomal protein S9 [Candidatus Vidania fulgoroideae]|uniref:Small ribosomal subunit protein uS9 n=1 Tax=Candidatus Vidania fulgoroideorum TaxID=881286 RepID=A0A974X7G8_9PROT|nr:30S ribosomal protein S9 [Candidatus Vidania fulgoroideae]
MLGIYFNSLGKKKTSVAKVLIKSGKRKIIVNNKNIYIYFKKGTSVEVINEILKEIDYSNLEIIVSVKGGGYMSQAQAVRMAISKCICAYDNKSKNLIRNLALSRFDSRVVERKKIGLVKSRKRKQFSKR